MESLICPPGRLRIEYAGPTQSRSNSILVEPWSSKDGDLRVTTDPLNSENQSKPDAGTASKLRSPGFLVVFSFAVILVTMLSVFATIPRKTANANAPAPAQPTATELAIQQDLTASKQKMADQIRELKEALATSQTERKRLSDAVAALGSKLENLQQSFARIQEAPPAQPADPAKRNRGNR